MAPAPALETQGAVDTRAMSGPVWEMDGLGLQPVSRASSRRSARGGACQQTDNQQDAHPLDDNQQQHDHIVLCVVPPSPPPPAAAAAVASGSLAAGGWGRRSRSFRAPALEQGTASTSMQPAPSIGELVAMRMHSLMSGKSVASELACRICLLSADETGEPLMDSPCDCTGSVAKVR
jgi:hypothetical protein